VKAGHGVAGMMAVLASASLGATPVSQQGQIEGEVLQVFSGVIVIKNEQGQAMVLQLTPRTQVGSSLKTGDKIVAYTSPYGLSSVQLKTNMALIP
jgi:hypothetical protein